MTVGEFVKNKIQKTQDIEKRILNSMQNHDFITANYLAMCQEKENNTFRNFIAKDQNVNETFKRLL